MDSKEVLTISRFAVDEMLELIKCVKLQYLRTYILYFQYSSTKLRQDVIALSALT